MAYIFSNSHEAYDEALNRIELCRKSGDSILDLESLGLQDVPPEIGQLKRLTTLKLGNNQLRGLPPELTQLSGITSLYLYLNKISILSSIGRLKAMQVLNLSDNELAILPPELGQLKALTTLTVNNNKLRGLPTQISQLRALKYLRASYNLIDALPVEIGYLRPIQIHLNNNQLETIPSEIGQLNSLDELLIENNRINRLPADIGRLSCLRVLGLRGNRLTRLPPEIGRLALLRSLTLENNELQELPDNLEKLRGTLHQLKLDGNAALQIPQELLSMTSTESGNAHVPQDPRAILDFYFSRRKEGEEPMREVRLLLVGRGRVGKTSLLKALRGSRPSETEPETPGITVQPLKIKCSQGTATGHVWDFGGQEFLHGTHQIFLAERCVYLLVLEGRGSNWEMETDYWLRFIQSFGGDSPVVVVLTKYDAHAFSVDRYRLQERCPQIVGFVETDAFTNRGIGELANLLAKTIEGMKDVWLPLPKKWHFVKQKLATMRKSFLDYRDYQSLCNEIGIEEEGKQISLAQTLHRLGIALNFRDHHRLQHTSVLKPKWVTEAIYGVIRFVQQMDCHGVLSLALLKEALNSGEYPDDKHGFVLELMEKFEVAFPLEGTKNWLIPELLREEQPEAFIEFRGPRVRRLRFSYPDALPPGLLPRLIVRTHQMSDAHREWRWRSGVVLEWNGCRALVRLDRVARRTEVEVIEWPEDDQQNLFDLIRAHLTVLHGRVRVVEEVELEGHPDTWVRVAKLRLLEERGTKYTEEETKGGELARVKVTETLDRVESLSAREASRDTAPPRMRLFVSYAHDDENKIRPLSKHLTILGERGYIQSWQDTQLVAGEEWKKRILDELGRADIVLLLYSIASRASRFIQQIEAPIAVKRAMSKDNPCTLIVVPLDRHDWDAGLPLEVELKKLQTATWNAKPVLKFSPQWDGWLEVEHSIRKAVEMRRNRWLLPLGK